MNLSSKVMLLLRSNSVASCRETGDLGPLMSPMVCFHKSRRSCTATRAATAVATGTMSLPKGINDNIIPIDEARWSVACFEKDAEQALSIFQFVAVKVSLPEHFLVQSSPNSSNQFA